MFCGNCGNEVADDAAICGKCGSSFNSGDSEREWTVTLLLCIFLGTLGIHRFYTGHMLYGVIQLLTGGGCGIWWLIDIILLATQKYTDIDGKPLKN